MQKVILFFAVSLFSAIFLTSCGLSTDQLAKEVEKNMKETEQFKNNSIQIKSFVLTKKSGNEYDGVLQTSEPNGDFTYSVDVVYDGKTFTWKIADQGSATTSSNSETENQTTAVSDYLQPTDINIDEQLVGKEVTVSGFYMHIGSLDFLYDEAGSGNFISLDISSLDKETKKMIFQNCSKGCDAVFKGVVSKEYGIIKLIVSEVIE